MTPMELEQRLEVLDALLAAAYQSGHPDATLAKLMHGVETLSYLQALHLMHHQLGQLQEGEEEL